MATVNSSKRNTSGHIDAGYKSMVRAVEFIVDLANDATMANATDDIALGTLPGGTVVLGIALQQLEAGTGSGTLVGRVGTTTMTATLASTATAGTVAATVPAALPALVPAAGAELNLLGATAVRTDGKVRVVVFVAEGDRSPRQATVTDRDQLA